MKLTQKKIISALESHRADISQYEVKRIGLFGSFQKGKARKGSDLDFLVEFRKQTFDNYMGLKFFLERLFKRKVDLIVEATLKPALSYVKKEAVYVRGI